MSWVRVRGLTCVSIPRLVVVSRLTGSRWFVLVESVARKTGETGVVRSMCTLTLALPNDGDQVYPQGKYILVSVRPGFDFSVYFSSLFPKRARPLSMSLGQKMCLFEGGSRRQRFVSPQECDLRLGCRWCR